MRIPVGRVQREYSSNGRAVALQVSPPSSFPSPLAPLSFLKRDDWGRVSFPIPEITPHVDEVLKKRRPWGRADFRKNLINSKN